MNYMYFTKKHKHRVDKTAAGVDQMAVRSRHFFFFKSSFQATNFHFMAEYGNPQLAKDEAGYYLTTLEAAVVFIETLSPDQLTLPAR